MDWLTEGRDQQWLGCTDGGQTDDILCIFWTDRQTDRQTETDTDFDTRENITWVCASQLMEAC